MVANAGGGTGASGSFLAPQVRDRRGLARLLRIRVGISDLGPPVMAIALTSLRASAWAVLPGRGLARPRGGAGMKALLGGEVARRGVKLGKQDGSFVGMSCLAVSRPSLWSGGC